MKQRLLALVKNPPSALGASLCLARSASCQVAFLATLLRHTPPVALGEGAGGWLAPIYPPQRTRVKISG
jgi:hypothetical protein